MFVSFSFALSSQTNSLFGWTFPLSLPIEKQLYLFRPQSFSFQIVSEFTNTLWNFLTSCPVGGAFDSLYCLEGRVFVQNDCLGGRVLLPSSRVSGVCPRGGLWMKLIPALHEIFFSHRIQNLIKNSTLGACFHFIGLFCYNALTVRVDKTCRKSCLEVIPSFILVQKYKKNRLMRHFFQIRSV